MEVDGIDQDHPLPDLEEFPGEMPNEGEGEVPDQDLLQQEQCEEDEPGDGEDGGHLAEATAMGSLDVWQRLVEESKNVAVMDRIYSRLRQLGLPVLRLHSDQRQGTRVHRNAVTEVGSA